MGVHEIFFIWNFPIYFPDPKLGRIVFSTAEFLYAYKGFVITSTFKQITFYDYFFIPLLSSFENAYITIFSFSSTFNLTRFLPCNICKH